METLPPEVLDVTVADLLKWIVLIGALVSFVVWLRKYVFPIIKQINLFLEDWQGEAARPGVPRRPGMVERIGNLEYEFQPNSGKSTRDKLDSIVEKQMVVDAQIIMLQRDVKQIKSAMGLTTESMETL